MRSHFVKELQRLQDEVLMMGSMVRQNLQESVDALRARDLEAAKRIIAADREVNRRKFAIEDACLSVIAMQQPMAGDLRLIAAILEISTELERMGDYAKGISRISIYIGNQPLLKSFPQIPQMCDMVVDTLGRALDAFINEDVDAARAIPLEDDELDALYNSVNRELIGIITEKADVLERANYISWVAHNLERAGDRVTNICERVIYTATGELVEFDAEEPDMSGVN